MKKITRLRQPEGGVDIFKKKPIPKKPRQPEGSGAPKKPIQRQPEGSGAPKKKKLIQRQPEGSGAPKKITGRFEFADTDRRKKSKTKVALPKKRPSSIKPKKVALPKKRPSSIKPKVKVKTPKNVSQGSTISKKTLVKTPKNVSQGSTISKKTSKKKPSFFEKIVSETKRNFSGNFKKGTGRYKTVSTGKTNFNKKKKKLPKQIRV